ncbi:hypothetical protein [Pseudomonas fitomaticsae]|uniref:Uncharacterized protein n=1 Tax=Pseudomonas fitomaticsae TaxID=2837969 RepID=A0ABY3Q6Y6_9PSED|nr:hypothetical protein [Pseudomonas fitomaticsae]UFQ01838.1 hypothetical protein KJY40_09125 [Pseudomonas fitomaticsae]
MTASTPPDNTVLVLYPPIVNGQTTPVEGAHIGVPLVAYDLVTDGEGAVVPVDPPSSGNMDPNDVMELWLKGEQAPLDSETIVNPNARTTLRIPKGRLHPDRINMLYYTVRRGSSNLGTSTPPLEILYNRIRPGLKDRLTDPGGHSELKLLLPDAIKNGVGPDFVSAEVCVAYPYCRAYDLITLKCNGELLEPKPRVNPNQAPQPPNPGDEEPIMFGFTVDRAYLERAKRLDQKLNFSYTVTDQLGNGPDPDAPWSPVQTVDEDLDGKRLPMAILLERMEDYPGDDAEEIDLVKLAGGPLLLVVLTIDPRFVAGYEVIATYTAKNTGQPADVVVTVSGKVEADPFGQKKPCILEVPNNKIFAGSNVIVTYELRKPNGDLVGNSRPATGTVTGSTPEDLLPPSLVAPAVNPIDVLAYPNGVTVRIEHLQARDGDRARLVEVNPPAGSTPFPLVAFNSNKRVNTVLSPAFLAERHGQNIEVRWNLNRDGGQAGKSPLAKFRVSRIADGDTRLPIPNVTQASSKTLNLNDFTGHAEATLRAWTGISTNQIINLQCTGTDNSGAAHTIELLTNHQVTAENIRDGFTKAIPRNELEKFKDGDNIHLIARVDFPSNIGIPAILLPTLTLTLISTLKEILITFDNEPNREIFSGESIEMQYVTITNISSSRPVTIRPATSNPNPQLKNIEGQVIFTPLGTCTIQLNFKNTYSYISFYQAWGDVTNRANYYNSKGALLGRASLTPTVLNPAQLIEFRNIDIARVEIITTNDVIALDNFKCIR